MRNQPLPMTAGQWLQLLLLGLIWGASFFFIKVAVAAAGPLGIVFWRCAIGALALLLLNRAAGLPLPAGRANWLRLGLLGLIGSLLPFTLISWAELYIPGALAGMLNATTPLFAAVLLHFATREERLTPARLGGLAAGLGGVALLLGRDLLHGGGASLLAQLAVLGAALLYALGAIYVKRLTHLPAPVIALGQLTCTALAALPLMVLLERPWLRPLPGAAVWLSLAALGLLSTALAQSLYYRLVARAGAANATLVTFIIPASATLLGVLVLGEHIGWPHIGGMTLIACGLALIDGRVLGWLRRGQAAG